MKLAVDFKRFSWFIISLILQYFAHLYRKDALPDILSPFRNMQYGSQRIWKRFVNVFSKSCCQCKVLSPAKSTGFRDVRAIRRPRNFLRAVCWSPDVGKTWNKTYFVGGKIEKDLLALSGCSFQQKIIVVGHLLVCIIQGGNFMGNTMNINEWFSNSGGPKQIGIPTRLKSSWFCCRHFATNRPMIAMQQPILKLAVLFSTSIPGLRSNW